MEENRDSPAVDERAAAARRQRERAKQPAWKRGSHFQAKRMPHRHAAIPHRGAAMGLRKEPDRFPPVKRGIKGAAPWPEVYALTKWGGLVGGGVLPFFFREKSITRRQKPGILQNAGSAKKQRKEGAA